MWCIRKLDSTYIARMKHALDLYAKTADIKQPIINFDKTEKQ